MSQLSSWQQIRDELRQRIHERFWMPGETIPKETDLALEFGCARATVNRAMRDLADAGLIERRRKGGTRVLKHPVQRATLRIPVIRAEVEAQGLPYGYRLIFKEVARPSEEVREAMRMHRDTSLHVVSLHLAAGQPVMIEDRWIGLDVMPQALDEAFTRTSANEWLLENAPFTHGELAFMAATADPIAARALEIEEGAALLTIERVTWDALRAITWVRQHYAPGYRLETSI